MASTYISTQQPSDHQYQHQSSNPQSASTSSAPTPDDNDFVSPTNLAIYPPSDLGDISDDPFVGYGGDYSEDGGFPTFLDDDASWHQSFTTSNKLNIAGTTRSHLDAADTTCPLTPDQTASIHTASPRTDPASRHRVEGLPASVSPQVLQRPFQPNPAIAIPLQTQLTPSQSSSGRSSEEGLAPAPTMMHCTSPKVTVSVWDKDNDGPTESLVRNFDESPSTVRGGCHFAGDLAGDLAGDPMSSYDYDNDVPASRDATGRWERNPLTGHAGLDPHNRPAEEVPSINELANQEKRKERNSVVGQWLDNNLADPSEPLETPAPNIQAIDSTRDDSNDGIPFGQPTENQYQEGQAYYKNEGGEMNDKDREWIASGRNFENAPMLAKILTKTRHQPQSSQAAIEKFNRMCGDTDSMLSRSATWGTRRRNSTSTTFDVEGLAGNLLKKLSIKERPDRDTKPGDFLRGLKEMVRRPSMSRKRRNSHQARGGEGLERQSSGSSLEKRDSVGSPLLAPPERTLSWGKRSSTPNISSMIASMGSSAASIGTTHTRKGSVGAISLNSPPPNIPRSPSLSLKVNNPITKRPRSKSAAASPNANESHPNLTGMRQTSGGPPATPLAGSNRSNYEPDDDEDEDDDGFEDDLQQDSNLIDDVIPNLGGFQQYVTALNPALADNAPYLVDRIAHQQVVRYKQLLSHKVKHIGLGANCPCAHLCIAGGGQAEILDVRGDTRALDPLSTHLPDDDDDGTPIEGAIAQDSFPPDIPMPPTTHLPAEFECQLCYGRKKFQKPSDWTKHVHEDVQPFTCTWDKCRDAKSFKRKADWVRHENEGHRHLDWWTCDVEECRHTCYRRDNFLQHLVREHKYQEPRYKTKAAIKKAGGADPTWQKVEQCHVLTNARPQDEPCRFCNKVLPTWKKLTVHLAKHMEQISLPVLRLVAAKAKELDADTIISPVQDLPPRNHLPIFPSVNGSGGMPVADAGMRGDQFVNIGYSGPFISTNNVMAGQIYSDVHHQPFTNLNSNLHHGNNNGLGIAQVNQRFMGGNEMSNIPVSSGSYHTGQGQYVAVQSNAHGLEPFPAVDALGVGMPMGNSHMAYSNNNMMATSTANGSPFSGHGSASPYGHSPHLGSTTAPDNNAWDDRRTSGFLG
ncbi:hypothetical protein N3K66_001304 [Trichothecium roseum]|uniref:Uncharacterized protein n=1 Tax=Trichothecium roseum TaxID=47278 RepID=A0ACC0VGD0_9HYPO|nr:hypothetical protein N3K66_001304 [Trichothecium roseum]